MLSFVFESFHVHPVVKWLCCCKFSSFINAGWKFTKSFLKNIEIEKNSSNFDFASIFQTLYEKKLMKRSNNNHECFRLCLCRFNVEMECFLSEMMTLLVASYFDLDLSLWNTKDWALSDSSPKNFVWFFISLVDHVNLVRKYGCFKSFVVIEISNSFTFHTCDIRANKLLLLVS